MKGSSAVIVQYLEQYERLGGRVNKSLRDYLGDPGPGQTQSLRAAVRRLDAAIRVLPKRTIDAKPVRRTHERCRELLRHTSKIRDIDIMRERLDKRRKGETVGLMLNNLQEEREEFVGDTAKAAWKLFEHHPPKLMKGDLPRFAHRVETVLSELDSEIARELEASVKDESKIDELHSLRKHCKRLRYTLELFPSSGNVSAPVLILRRWQDVLGEIRDSDVVIDYFSRARPSRPVREILSRERSRRHETYLAFLRISDKGWPGTKPITGASPAR